MSAPKVGDDFPEGVSFTYIPYAPENDDVVACGLPVKYDASKGSRSAKTNESNSHASTDTDLQLVRRIQN